MKDDAKACATPAACSDESPTRRSGLMRPCPAASPMAAACSGGSPRAAIAGTKAAFSVVVRTVPRTAIPSTPPTSRLVFVIADPRPARCGPTAFMTAAVIGAITAPIPCPITVNTGSMYQYERVRSQGQPQEQQPAAGQEQPVGHGAARAVVRGVPARQRGRDDDQRGSSAGTARPPRTARTRGFACMYSERKKNVANMPSETEKATVLPAENDGIRKNASGIIGCGARCSQARNATEQDRRQATSEPTISGSLQPFVFASIRP